MQDVPVLIVVAGGSSRRYGKDKLFEMLDGKPVFIHTLERLAPAAKRTVLVVPPDKKARFRKTAAEFLPELAVVFADGGASRPESVRSGLAAAGAAPDELVAIHDAARPLADAQLLRELCELAAKVGGAVPGFPQADAQKYVDEQGIVRNDLPRSGVWNVGTPQVFRAESLQAAYRGDVAKCLDDAEAVRAAGGTVAVLPADAPNIIITRPGDLEVLEILLRRLSRTGRRRKDTDGR